jgi:hypothetical protein
MLDFSNASLLSYSYKPIYFGESFAYRVDKNISVKGIIDNLLNTNGVKKTFDGVNEFISGAHNFDQIIIGGVNLGSGIINSISFDAGNWVRKADYTADITVYETGSLYNMLGAEYSGIDIIKHKDSFANLIDSLDEKFSFKVDEATEYSVSHSLNFNLRSGINEDIVNRAKFIASGVMMNRANFGFIGYFSGFYNNSCDRIYDESYDFINGSIAFSEDFKTRDRSNLYTKNITHSKNTNENGITFASESSEIRSLTKSFSDARNGFTSEIALAYSRCSSFCGAGISLITDHVSKDVSFDNFEKVINYTITYSDDARRANILYTLDIVRTIELNKEDLRTLINRIECSIVGDGTPGSQAKIDNAIIGYNSAPKTMAGILISKSDNFDIYMGRVSFTNTFYTSSLYKNGLILKEASSKITFLPVPEYNFINIGQSKYAEKYNQDSLPKRSFENIKVFRNGYSKIPFDLIEYQPIDLAGGEVLDAYSLSFNHPGNSISTSYSVTYLNGLKDND